MLENENQETISTNHLLVLDKKGRTRIRFSVFDWGADIHDTENEQPMIEFLDEYGTTRAWIGLGVGGTLQVQSLDPPQTAPVASE